MLLVSNRLQEPIPDARIRLLIGLLYLLPPDSAEVQGNLTNSQWYLAVASILLLLSDSTEVPLTRVGELAFL